MKRIIFFYVFIIFMLFVPVSIAYTGPETAQGQPDNNVTVFNVNISNNTQEQAFLFKPDDFKEIRVVRHGIKYIPNNFEVKGILKDENTESWRQYWRYRLGRSIKTIIGNTVAQDTRLIVTTPEEVPLGFTRRQEAFDRAKLIKPNPKFIDDFTADERRDDKERNYKMSDSEGLYRQGGHRSYITGAPAS